MEFYIISIPIQTNRIIAIWRDFIMTLEQHASLCSCLCQNRRIDSTSFNNKIKTKHAKGIVFVLFFSFFTLIFTYIFIYKKNKQSLKQTLVNIDDRIMFIQCSVLSAFMHSKLVTFFHSVNVLKVINYNNLDLVNFQVACILFQ